MNLRFFPNELEDVLNSEGVQKELKKHANAIQAGVRDDLRSSPGVQVFVRSGKSPRGAFAQVVMRDEEHVAGAMAIEFGTRGTGPKAPLRSALARRRR